TRMAPAVRSPEPVTVCPSWSPLLIASMSHRCRRADSIRASGLCRAPQHDVLVPRGSAGRTRHNPLVGIMHLAALDDRHRPARVPDRLAEARPAVDDEEHRLVEIEPALADVREERLADGRVLGRTLAQGEDMLAALEIHAQRDQDDVVPEVE